MTFTSSFTNIDKVGTSGQGQTAVTTSTSSFNDNGTIYYGSNRSDDTKFITVANKKLKVTADTAVLFVDSAADEDNQIGVNYTYGTTAMAKAEEYASNSYSYNVMFMVDETKADDVNLKVLVVDTTGAFDGQKHNDSNGGNKDNTDTSKIGNITINVASATGITSNDVAASIDTDNKMTVALPKDADVKITVTVNKVTMLAEANKTSSAKKIVGDQAQYTVTGVSKNDTVIVTVTKGA